MNKKVKFLTYSAVIAALYIVLTYVAQAFGLASGAIQLRLSEALCILPYFTPAAIPGLFIGCLLANVLTGCVFWDVIFGSLATLIGALGARAIRNHKWFSSIPTILSNAIIVGLVIAYVSVPNDLFSVFPMIMLTVGIGEVISCGIFGTALIFVFERYDSIKKIFTI
jgi:uncharacterized membrane protein